jgi:hypothetical protein
LFRFYNEIDRMANEALRTIGLAYADVDENFDVLLLLMVYLEYNKSGGPRAFEMHCRQARVVTICNAVDHVR